MPCGSRPTRSRSSCRVSSTARWPRRRASRPPASERARLVSEARPGSPLRRRASGAYQSLKPGRPHHLREQPRADRPRLPPRRRRARSPRRPSGHRHLAADRGRERGRSRRARGALQLHGVAAQRARIPGYRHGRYTRWRDHRRGAPCGVAGALSTIQTALLYTFIPPERVIMCLTPRVVPPIRPLSSHGQGSLVPPWRPP